MGQFSVGEVVTCIPHLICRSAAPGDYQIVGESRSEMAITFTGSRAHLKNTSVL
jgi:hypothetical protein